MKKLKELRQKLAALVTEERSQLERIKKEDRAFDATETEQYEKRAKDIGDVEAEISQLELVEKRDSENRAREERLGKLTSEPEKPEGDRESRGKMTDVEKRAVDRYIRGGMRALDSSEIRALSAGSDVEGGFLRMPQQMVNQILKGVDDAVIVRALATKYQVGGAESLGVPTLTTDVNDADWTSELLTGSEDTALRFGKRELRPHPLAKSIKISNKLRQASVFDIVSFIQGRFAYKFGLTQEKAYMTGTGVQQPLGLFIGSNDGIPTSRDVSTDNTSTSISGDGLINAKYSIKSQYWPNLRWLFHRDAVKQIRKLKNGAGEYLWNAGIADGLGARIVDSPYTLSEYVPNTFTSGLYVGIIGDFSYYWIVDSLDYQLQVLNELYAATNQTGYIARVESDGQPVLSEAFARVKLG